MGQEPRDGWSKAEVISRFVVPALTAIVVALFTHWYHQAQIRQAAIQQERELAVARIEAVTNLLPHVLDGDDASSEAALKSIAALGDPALAESIALAVGGSAAVAAVKSFSATGQASAGLGTLLDAASQSVFVARGGDNHTAQANGFVFAPSLLLTTTPVAAAGPPYSFFFPATGIEVEAELVTVDELRGTAVFKCEESILAPVLPIAGESPSDQVFVAAGFTSGGLWTAIPASVQRDDAMFVVSYPSEPLPADEEDLGALLAGITTQILSMPGRVDLRLPPGFDGAVILDNGGIVVGQIATSATFLGDHEVPPDDSAVLFLPAEELRKILCYHLPQQCP